jgi:outer membrane protein TolC
MALWALGWPAAAQQPEEAARAIAAARAGGAVIVCRHAITAPTREVEPVDYDDPSTQRMPRVSLGGVAGYTANAFGALGDTGTPRYALGAVVSWPFLDLGRVKAGVDEARAHEIEAEARHEQAVLEAREEIETSLTAYRRARERLRHLGDAAASERATELACLRFEEGGTDFLEVLDAERRQLEAQDRLAAGHTEAAGWLVSVYRATGGASALPGG